MKKILILVFGLFPFLGRAQQILPVSLNPGQQYVTSSTNLITNPGDSLQYREYWCFNSNCQLNNLDTTFVFVADTVVDTLSVTNIVEVQNTGSQPINVYHQRLLINLLTGDTLGNIIMPVTIYPDFSDPLVSYVGFTSNTDTINIIYSVVPNDTSAEVKFWARYQDCNAPQIWLLHTENVSGFTLQNLQYTIPAAFGCNYQVGIQLEIVNSVETDTTGWQCTYTQSCGSPYVTTYDSLVAGITTMDLYGRVATMNQDVTILDSVAFPGQPYFAGISVQVPGQQFVETPVHQQITNLNPGTLYAFKRCVLDSSGALANCQGPILMSTLQAPVYLAFDIQNAMTTNSTTERIDVLQTSSVSGVFWLEFSTNSNFTGIVATSAFPCSTSMNFTGGQIAISFNACYLSSPLHGSQNFQNGMTYWVRAVGNNVNGETAMSAPFMFIFNWTVGISEIVEFSNIFVADGQLIIQNDYVGELNLFDSAGRLLVNVDKNDPTVINIPVYNLKPGLYYLRGIGRYKKFSIGF